MSRRAKCVLIASGLSLLISWPLACVSSAPTFAPTEGPTDGRSPTSDVPPSTDAGTSKCDPAGKFTTVTSLDALNVGDFNQNPFASPDERTVYFNTNRLPNDAGSGGMDLAMASRLDRDASFSPPVPVPGVNTPYDEGHPWVSADQQRMLFFGNGAGDHTLRNLFFATRSPSGNFTAQELPASVNIPGVNQVDPFLREGVELWFSSDQDAAPSRTLRRSKVVGTDYAPPQTIPSISAPNELSNDPYITDDGLVLYFSSSRGGPDKKDLDIWRAIRTSIHDDFSNPSPVEELNSSIDEGLGSLSPDGCRVYFGSDRRGRWEIFVGERTPP